jgi:hypothetical protein
MSYSTISGLTGIDFTLNPITYLTISSYVFNTLSSYVISTITISDVLDRSTLSSLILETNSWCSNTTWNRYLSMYVKGYIDLSGGDITIRRGSLYVQNSINSIDVSLMKKLYDLNSISYSDEMTYLNNNTCLSGLIYLNNDIIIGSPSINLNIQNYNFELPDISNNTYSNISALTNDQQTQLIWIGSGAKIANNTSVWNFSIPYPSGNQCIIFQSTNYIYRDFYLIKGSYRISFYMCKRPSDTDYNPVTVTFNNINVYTVSTPNTTWDLYSVDVVAPTNGTFRLRFEGTITGKSTALDSVSIKLISTVINPSQIGYLSNLTSDIQNQFNSLSSTVYNLNNQSNINNINSLYSYCNSLSALIYIHNNNNDFDINNIYSGISSLSGLMYSNNFSIGLANTNITNLYSGFNSLSGVVFTYNKNDNFNINNLYKYCNSISGIVYANYVNSGNAAQDANITTLYGGLSSLSGIVYTNYLNSGIANQQSNINTLFSTYSSLSGIVYTYNRNDNFNITNLYKFCNSISGIVYNNYVNSGNATQDANIGNLYTYCNSISSVVFTQNKTNVFNTNNLYGFCSSISGITYSQNKSDGQNINNLLTKTNLITSNGITSLTLSGNLNTSYNSSLIVGGSAYFNNDINLLGNYINLPVNGTIKFGGQGWIASTTYADLLLNAGLSYANVCINHNSTNCNTIIENGNLNILNGTINCQTINSNLINTTNGNTSTFNGQLVTNDLLSCFNGLTVNSGTTTIDGPLVCNYGLNVNGGTSSFTNTATFNGSLVCNNSLNCYNGLSVYSGTTNINDKVNFNSTVKNSYYSNTTSYYQIPDAFLNIYSTSQGMYLPNPNVLSAGHQIIIINRSNSTKTIFSYNATATILNKSAIAITYHNVPAYGSSTFTYTHDNYWIITAEYG